GKPIDLPQDSSDDAANLRSFLARLALDDYSAGFQRQYLFPLSVSREAVARALPSIEFSMRTHDADRMDHVARRIRKLLEIAREHGMDPLHLEYGEGAKIQRHAIEHFAASPWRFTQKTARKAFEEAIAQGV